MKVIHILENLSAEHGGSTTAAFCLAEATSDVVEIEIVGPFEKSCLGKPAVTMLKGFGICFLFRLLMFIWSRRKSTDIFEIHNVFGPTPLASILFCALIRAKFLVNPHNSLTADDLRKKRLIKLFLGHSILGWAIWRCGFVRCATARELAELNRFGWEWQTDWALYPFIQKNPFSETPESRPFLQTSSIVFRILFMSRIDAKKQLEVLFKAVAERRTELEPFEIHICGSGPREYEECLRRLGETLEIGQNLKWHGFVKGAEKLRFLKEADLFVLPSSYENYGIVVLEAIACGRRAVISDKVYIEDHLPAEMISIVSDGDYGSVLVLAKDNPAFFTLEKHSVDILNEIMLGEIGAKKIVNIYKQILGKSLYS